MNRRRLLLFSVFALLHITTSERNFIDERYCNTPSCSLFTYEKHRVPVIQQENNPDKYSNSFKRDVDITRLSEHRPNGYMKQHARDDDILETVERHRKRILIKPTKEILGRQNFRERIRRSNNAFQNDFCHSRFAILRKEHQRNIRLPSSFFNKKVIDIARNQFENIDVTRYNHNDCDAFIPDSRDNRQEVRRNLLELVERNTNRNNMRNDLRRAVRQGRNIRKITSNIVNANDRINRRILNVDEELSQNTENGKLSRINELATGTRYYNSELKDTSRIQRDRTENTYESRRITQRDHRRSIDQFDLNRERENVRTIKRMSSRETYVSRDSSNDDRVQLERRNANKNVRYNRDTKEISRIKREQFNASPDGNREYINSKWYLERNMLDSRIRNTNRRSESSDNRDRNENRFIGRRSHMERAVERDNKRITKRSLQTEKISVRDALRRFEGIQRSTNDASDKMSRRDYEEFRYSPKIRENDISRRNSVIERGDRLQANNRREIINDKIPSINIEGGLENQRRFTVRQDENKTKFRNHRNVVTVSTGIQIVRTNIEDEFRQRSRSLSNIRLLLTTTTRQDTRKTDNERRLTRNIDDERGQPRNIGDERKQTRNINDERRQTRNIDDDRRQTRNIDDERGQPRNIGDERRQTRNINDERRRTRNIDDERRQTRNIDDERGQLRNIGDERRQTRNINDERRQTRNIDDERRQTRNIDDERRQTRNIDDERRQTRKTEDRSINVRRMTTVVDERRDSKRHPSENRRFIMTYKKERENNIIELKWQYLFYALQLVYLCNAFMKIPKDNEENKQKIRFANLFTSAEYLKID